MTKRLFKSAAVAAAAALSVTSVPLPAQAASKISVSSCVISQEDKMDLDIKGINEKSGKYATSAKKTAAVTKKGIVTAKKVGNAKITWRKGGKKYTCKVKVVKAPVLSKKKLTIAKNQKGTVTVKKYGNKKLSVTWSSSNKKVAKVSGGKITGVSEGKAVIKAQIKGYKKVWKREIEVTVKKEKVKETAEPQATAAPDATKVPGGSQPSHSCLTCPQCRQQRHRK